jgi:hypothetical protein
MSDRSNYISCTKDNPREWISRSIHKNTKSIDINENTTEVTCNECGISSKFVFRTLGPEEVIPTNVPTGLESPWIIVEDKDE